MRFRSRLIALMVGMIALVTMLLMAGWWASGRLLDVTDTAYQQGLQLTRTIDAARAAQIAFQRQVQEWKNVLIRGSDNELRDRHWKAFETQEALMDKMLQELAKNLPIIGMAPLSRETKKIVNDHKSLGQLYRAALQKQPRLDFAAQAIIDKEVRGVDRPTSAGIDSLVENLQKLVAERFKETASEVRSNVTNEFFATAVLALFLTLVLLIVAITLARNVLNILGADPEEAVEATKRMARGDLTERLNAKSPASLMGALEMMQSRLRNISLAIRGVGDDITARANLLTETVGRDALLNDVTRLRDAIGRIRIEREDEQSS
jgi:methyl-accepting chemotaxis protein